MYKDPKKFTLKVHHPTADVTWKNAKVVTHAKKSNMAAYENKPENNPDLKKNFKDEDGGVITGPPNIKAQPMKKGIIPSNIKRLGQNSSLFHAVHDHVYNNVADNYDRQKELLKEELEYHKEKVGERPPFAQSASHNWKKKRYHFGSINHPAAILAENPPVPAREMGPKPKSEAELMAGDRPWNPTGNKTKAKRVHDFLGDFPQFMANPYEKEKVKYEKPEDAPPPFKLTHNRKSRPTPSVALNVRNLRT